MELIFLWLVQLGFLIGLAIDLNCIQSKFFNDNCDKTNDDINNEIDGE